MREFWGYKGPKNKRIGTDRMREPNPVGEHHRTVHSLMTVDVVVIGHPCITLSVYTRHFVLHSVIYVIFLCSFE